MSARKFDIIVFGSTGFTGKRVVEELVRTADAEGTLKWAIAGRKMTDLQETLNWTSKVTGKDITDLPIVIANLNVPESLTAMCQQTSILLNCVGPYRLFGTEVVETCIATGTHHIDISGETLWMERVHVEFNKIAQEREVYIIQACGFDSIPAEMGVVHLVEHFKGDLNSIESYVSFHSGKYGMVGHDSTWMSAVLSYATSTKDRIKETRGMLYPQSLPIPRQELKPRSKIFFSKDVNAWCMPFIGSDNAIVRRSIYFNYVLDQRKPVQYKPYMAFSRFTEMLTWLYVGVMLLIFSKFKFGVGLLTRYPRFFTLGKFSSSGPSKQQIQDTSFEMTFIGEGFSNESSTSPDKKIMTKVIGPEPGYVTTPICVVQAAYILMKEKDKLPNTYGVMTPGRAFSKTSMIERLKKRNITFSEA